MVIGMALTQKSLTPEHQYEMDEFQCLNLNVTCPKGLAQAEGFPVAVWVHGYGAPHAVLLKFSATIAVLKLTDMC